MFALAVSVGTDVIHRVIEAHAVRHRDRAAIVDQSGALSYHVLNSRANAFARVLMCAGLRRAGHAIVTGEPGADLAVALLAVLKTGASYTWSRRTEVARPLVAIRVRDADAQEEYLVIDATASERLDQPSPNLPVMVRGGDVACVAQTADGCEAIPHRAIASRADNAATHGPWSDDTTATALWVALMGGETITASTRAAAAA